MTQYIETYVKYVYNLFVVIKTSFDVDQLKYVDSLFNNKQLKVMKNYLLYV